MKKPKVDKNEPPRTVSHYTTLEGLKGIIGSKSLWASNALFLNDKAELEHALKASESVMKKLSSESAYKDLMPLLARNFEKLKAGLGPETYVACFCADDDNLSQWRGYGGDIQGVSITFRRDALAKRLESDAPMFFKVLYSKYSTVQKLKRELVKEIESMNEIKNPTLNLSDIKKDKLMLNLLSGLLPRLKHIGFKDEREWRFAFQPQLSPSKLMFRVSKNKIVPYIIVGLAPEDMPITSIRVGPGPDQELTLRSIKAFLSAHNHESVEVKLSEVPFRT